MGLSLDLEHPQGVWLLMGALDSRTLSRPVPCTQGGGGVPQGSASRAAWSAPLGEAVGSGLAV